MKIEFIVWQFVRVMVEMENRYLGKKKSEKRSFYFNNLSTWKKLDNELESLNSSAIENDQRQYSNMMMKDKVFINTDSIDQTKEIIWVLGVIINKMSSSSRKESKFDDRLLKDSVDREVQDLKKLRDNISWKVRKS